MGVLLAWLAGQMLRHAAAPYATVHVIMCLQEAEAQARRDLEAIMADSSQSEEAKRRAKDALRKQHEEMQVGGCDLDKCGPGILNGTAGTGQAAYGEADTATALVRDGKRARQLSKMSCQA